MKINKIIITIILFQLFIVSQSFGSKIKDETKKMEIYGILYFHPNIYDGSPYLYNDWSFSSLELVNGDVVDNVRVKYNILTSEIIFYHDKFRKLFAVDQATLKSFTINYNRADSLHFEKYNGNDIGYRLKKNDFVHLLYKGNLKFIVKHTANVSEANDLNSKDKIFPKNIYFIIKGNETIEIRLKTKSVLKIFPEHKQELKKLISENKIKNHSEKELARFIKLIDENLK